MQPTDCVNIPADICSHLIVLVLVLEHQSEVAGNLCISVLGVLLLRDIKSKEMYTSNKGREKI